MSANSTVEKGSSERVMVPCRNCLERTLLLDLRPGTQDLVCSRCDSTTRVVIELQGADLVLKASVLKAG